MRKFIGVSCMLLLVFVGCRKSTSSAGGVAVVDLDRIARSMGWVEEMSKSLQAADTELKGQLDGILRNSLKSIDEMKKQVAADAKLTPEQTKQLDSIKDPRQLDDLPLSKEQRERLVEAVNKANAAWQGSLNSYQQALQGRRAQLVIAYRERIRPVAQQVATARGLSVVLSSSDQVLFFDPRSADITDQVVQELQKSSSATTPAPAPLTR